MVQVPVAFPPWNVDKREKALMGRYAWGDVPAADAIVERVVAETGKEISALGIPRLAGVVLGGGYGRGEGGVFLDDGDIRLANDLDFYVVTEDGATPRDIEAIGGALEPVSRRWTETLGIDVDFCTAKTPARLRRDERRLMVQELLNGYFDVAGKKGEELFAHVRRLSPGDLPWTEAVRLLVNRGAGLLLAKERGDGLFSVRNINKCVLGAFDAKLISDGRYAWKAVDREKAANEELYSKALMWKFRPSDECVCSWEEAREVWLDAADAVVEAGRDGGLGGRTVRNAVRWLRRRGTVGRLSTLGFNPVVRMLEGFSCAIRSRGPFPPGLRRDWEVFG